MAKCWACEGDGVVSQQDFERIAANGHAGGFVCGPCPICELGKRTYGPECYAHAVAKGKTDAVLMEPE